MSPSSPATGVTTASRPIASPTGPTCGRCAASACARCCAPSAVGSLRAELGPGALVVPDQLIDRTSGRIQTFYDAGGAVHVSFSDPYCPDGRSAAVSVARSSGWEVSDGGTLVVIEGPRFSTRAESKWFASMGCTIVGMTGLPESILARELALCYTSISSVTDHDAGVEAGEGVTHEEVMAFFAANVERMRSLVGQVVQELPEDRACACGARPRRDQAAVRTAVANGEF